MATKAKFTKEWADKIVDGYVEYFCFCFMLHDGGMDMFEVNDHRVYIVCICPIHVDKVRDRQIYTLIHELLHVFHDIWGLSQDEDVIERKTKRFFRYHKQFAGELFDRVTNGGKSIGSPVWTEGSKIVSFREMRDKVRKCIEEKYGRN